MDTQPPLMKQVTIYTDGACQGNPGMGGWGAILCWDGHEKEISGRSEGITTNNRMEMLAVTEALKALKIPCKVTIHTDSELIVKGMNERIEGWIAKGWKTAKKKPVLNRDLWLEILEAQKGHDVSYRWVRAHSGDPMNERADTLAYEALGALDHYPSMEPPREASTWN